MGMIDSFIHPEDAYKEAAAAANKGYKESKNYLTPYHQQGQDQYSRLNEMMRLLSNPQELLNQWSSGYETSPFAQRQLEQNQASGLDAASSMGLSGSSAALGNIQQGAGDIMQRDRREYLNDLMQKYMAGIGLGQNLYGVGANAGSQLSSHALEHGNNMAGLKYGEQAAPGKLFENLVKTGTSMYGMTEPGQNMFPGYQPYKNTNYSGNRFNPGA